MKVAWDCRDFSKSTDFVNKECRGENSGERRPDRWTGLYLCCIVSLSPRLKLFSPFPSLSFRSACRCVEYLAWLQVHCPTPYASTRSSDVWKYSVRKPDRYASSPHTSLAHRCSLVVPAPSDGLAVSSAPALHPRADWPLRPFQRRMPCHDLKQLQAGRCAKAATKARLRKCPVRDRCAFYFSCAIRSSCQLRVFADVVQRRTKLGIGALGAVGECISAEVCRHFPTSAAAFLVLPLSVSDADAM